MKVRASLFVACAIALGLSAAPLAVKAQSNSSAPTQVAPQTQKSPLQSLGLSETQQAQIQAIRQKTREQMKNVLTSQQQEQLTAAMQNPQARRAALQNLNLTEDQKDKMQQIMKSQETQIEAILTPQQKKQLDLYRENMHSRRHQNNQ